MEPPQSRPFNQDAPPVMRQESNGHLPSIHIDGPDGASSKGHSSHRGRYKEKFTAIREKYEKATRTQEVFQKQLELANSKIKKLQAENDLLLDVMLVNEETLFYRFFPPNQPSNQHLQRDIRPGPLTANALPPSSHHTQQLPYHINAERSNDSEPQPHRSAGTIRIGPIISTAPRRSTRRQQQQAAHTVASPSPVEPNNSVPQSPGGASYGRYTLLQPNGRESSPPLGHQHQQQHHLGPPAHHVNGASLNEPTSMLPPQAPYERPLEFISHDANGRV